MSLIELAERVEKASGPDRELDVAIGLASGWSFREWWVLGKYREVTLIDPRGDQCGNAFNMPAFTASLDAAMTLVPESSTWSLDNAGQGDCSAEVQADPQSESADGYAATPAPALCAAALRARAQQTGERQ